MIRTLALMMVLALTLAGCAAPLPTYPWKGPDEATRILLSRSQDIQTLQSSATLRLEKPDGSAVTLDAAILMRRPDSMRIRAWKLGHAAFDLTLNPEGLWLKAGGEEPAGLGGPGGPRQESVLRALSLILGEGQETSAQMVDTGGPTIEMVWAAQGETQIRARIDRATLTPRLYRMVDAQGRDRATITLDRYTLVNGAPWPGRVSARGEHGSATITFGSVHLNEELPPTAFVPPAGARKQE